MSSAGRASALLSAGCTHLACEVDVGDFGDDADDNLGNVQLALRALLVGPLEAEAGIGVLFDDEDTSDPLWNAGLRYRFSP